MTTGRRVALVYPDYSDSGVFRGPQLPVGLGYVARALEAAGIYYEVFDLNLQPVDALIRAIPASRIDCVGIGMMSYRCTKTYELLQYLKTTFPELTIIAGGPHVTANRELVLNECQAIDTGVVGEGETTFVELLRSDEARHVKGLVYRDGASIAFSGERGFVENLDALPFPTYTGFQLKRYGNLMHLASSRGCPYRCIFCGAPRLLGRKWRSRSAKSMLAQLQYWYDRGYRDFYFSDSNFAIDKARVSEFCSELVSCALENITFVADGVRADHVDRALLTRMRRAGFTALTFGVESGSNAVLRRLKKGETRDQIETALQAATELGFEVSCYFLIGSPGEDPGAIRESFRLARKYDIAKAYFYSLTPIPGTELYDWAAANGYIDPFAGRYPDGNFGYTTQATMASDVLTRDQLTHWLRQAKRVDKQIQWRHRLRKYLQSITGREFRTNNPMVSGLAWCAARCSVVRKALRPLWRGIKLLDRTVRERTRVRESLPRDSKL